MGGGFVPLTDSDLQWEDLLRRPRGLQQRWEVNQECWVVTLALR